MRIKTHAVLLLGIISLVGPFSLTCLAKTTINATPKVSTGWRMDSNFYKAETNERQVYTYLIQPGIDLVVETPKSRMLFDYSLDLFSYNDQDTVPSNQEPADREDYTGHTANLDARTKPFDRMTFGMFGAYYKTRDPSQSDPFSNAIDRDIYSINRLTPWVFYEFNRKYYAGLRYRYTDADYAPAAREDSTEQRAIMDLIYNLNRFKSLDLEYQRWQRDYSFLTSEYTSNQVKLIFKRQLKFFLFEAGGGYHKRTFSDPALDDFDMFTYRIGATGQNPPAPEPMPKSHISIIAESNLNDWGPGDQYYEAQRIALNAGRLFLDKLPVSISVSYQKSDFQRNYGITPAGTIELIKDDTFRLEGGIDYLFKDWLIFNVTTGYEDRDSNIAGRNYQNRYFMLKADFQYDLEK